MTVKEEQRLKCLELAIKLTEMKHAYSQRSDIVSTIYAVQMMADDFMLYIEKGKKVMKK